MTILIWLLAIVTFPFWFPLVLIIVGLGIALFGIILLPILLISLGIIICILQICWNTHKRLTAARKRFMNRRISWK